MRTRTIDRTFFTGISSFCFAVPKHLIYKKPGPASWRCPGLCILCNGNRLTFRDAFSWYEKYQDHKNQGEHHNSYGQQEGSVQYAHNKNKRRRQAGDCVQGDILCRLSGTTRSASCSLTLGRCEMQVFHHKLHSSHRIKSNSMVLLYTHNGACQALFLFSFCSPHKVYLR